MRTLRVALAQINTAVGDLEGNSKKVVEYAERARDAGADLVAFPELTLTGYPPEDLILYPGFVAAGRKHLKEVSASIRGISAVIGFIGEEDNHRSILHNSAALVSGGSIVNIYDKIFLPNYGVFDEKRYFNPGYNCPIFQVSDVNIGINICEDIWKTPGPTEIQSAAGAEVIININASPYWMSKFSERHRIVSGLSRRNSVFTAYVNQVGGQDDLVYDGGSFVYGPDGQLISQAARFEEDLLVVDFKIKGSEGKKLKVELHPETKNKIGSIGQAVRINTKLPSSECKKPVAQLSRKVTMDTEEEVYRALVLGTRDYIHKTGFRRAVVALSGGIDSTLTAVIAADAIGNENVVGIAMPSRYSSEGSLKDAQKLANRLDLEFWVTPIEKAHKAFESVLSDHLGNTAATETEENLQARIRGIVVMAASNEFGWLVLTTGNKSEMATGYATLYGDMAGGFAVLKDVPKTLVYRLCEYRNKAGADNPIPQSVIDKPPSAELRPNQFDSDTLPPYSVLDRILENYIENRWSEACIISDETKHSNGASSETVKRVLRMVDRNEYKRRQSPPGVKITSLAFGRDRRLPIASLYRK